MVNPAAVASKPVSPQCAALARAFERAKAERLVCFPAGKGVWECKNYTQIETGERPQDVQCNCVAGQRGLTCKHAVCVVFCRKHGVRPIKPATDPLAAQARRIADDLSGGHGATTETVAAVRASLTAIKPIAPSTPAEVAYTKRLMAETTTSLISGVAPSLAEMFA